MEKQKEPSAGELMALTFNSAYLLLMKYVAWVVRNQEQIKEIPITEYDCGISKMNLTLNWGG